jgi:hypothetical protein
MSLLLLQVGGAHATTWHVERDGSGDFLDIPSAIEAASVGDTIRIGAGRFTETVPFEFAVGYTTDAYIPVSVDSLTIIGSGIDETTIGPTTPSFVGEGPKGVVAPLRITRLTVESMTIENVLHGAYLSGESNLRHLRVRTCDLGVWEFTVGASVDSCEFSSNNVGVLTSDGCSGLVIEDCILADNSLGVSVNRTLNVAIRSCHFENSQWYTGGIQYSENSTGSVVGCTFDGSQSGIDIRSQSEATLERNDFHGQEYSLFVYDGSIARGSKNIFRGSYAAIRMGTTSTAYLSGNHILKSGQWAVDCRGFTTQAVDIDLRNNYWGTDNADSIAAWIFDGNDPQDPFYETNLSNVLYEPFSPVPVKAKETSTGKLKSMFHRR